MKHSVYGVLDYAEIIARYITTTAPIEGPTCFPVSIRFDAGNRVEPPIISVEVCETQSDGSEKVLYYTGTDQNTSLEAFLSGLDKLRDVVMTALSALSEGISYEEAKNKPVGEESEEEFSAF